MLYGEIAGIAEKRINIYGLLSLVYLHEPTEKLVSILRRKDIKYALSEGGINLDLPVNSERCDILLDELAVEYTCLFLGPGKHISPYESVWHNDHGMLWGKTTSEVKTFIESLGLEYRADWSGLPDHIGVELELMHRLTSREKEAWEQQNKKTAYLCLEIEKRFIEEHVIQWVPAFCQKVIEESSLNFYRQLALLTKQFIEFDRGQIKALLTEGE
ncbi:MAG TPA: hypothetical protein ENI06_03625 [Spirochaetales bacterium]|nr:hypothetical protein [Spirochaetales bacterium]